MKILYNIAILGKLEEIPFQFFKIIEKTEPSPHVFFQWSSAIVRTCCQHKMIVKECIRAMQIVIDLEPRVEYKLELAYQTYFSGQYKDAIKLYSDLTNEDELCPKAVEGIVLCHIAMNNIDVQVIIIFKFIRLQ